MITIANLLKARRLLSTTEIIEILGKILSSVKGLSMVDGSLTPDRILMLDDGEVRILYTKHVSPDPEFSAPEVLKGLAYPSSDIYSVGLIGICLLTGLKPFELFDISSNSWVWQDYYSHTDQQLVKILNQAIDPDFNNRFVDSRAMLTTLSGSYSHLVRSPMEWSLTHTLTGHQGLFSAINEVLVTKEFIISGSDDRTIRIWHQETKELITVLCGHGKSVNTMVIHPHHPYLFTGGKDGKIICWDLSNFQSVLTMDTQQNGIKTLSITGDGKLLISGSGDRSLKIWCSDKLTLLNGYRPHELAINQIAINPHLNSVIFATVSSDRQVILWNKHQPLTILKGHLKGIRTLAFHPHFQLLATGGDDGYINIWNIDRPQLVHTISAHSWPISRLIFSHNGRYLISSSTNGQVKIWEVDNWTAIDAFFAHDKPILGLAINQNDSILYTASADKTVKIWHR